jgi:hypothetical protein
MLRSYYKQLGRVEAGVLWPHEIGTRMLQPGLDDQGIREIVALATAAQAFEVCSGEVTDKESRKDTLSRDQSAETTVNSNLKDFANKALGLGAGVLVGIGAIPALGVPGGAAAGVATGALSTLTLNWTSKRSRKDERARDYTFIRRRDKETLERDLPLVIQRVREAGLAPVFVLDELDKLADPKASIANLIRSLKHLTTDYGFFCFLTDRDYYDYVMHRVRKEAFPVEHSFFSHRMFILHQPSQILNYLSEITKSETTGPGTPPVSSALAVDEVTARATFGLLILHRSKLNLIEILRKIAEECHADGRVRPSIGKLVSDPGYQFAATIQLVIGLLLRGSDLKERVENESRFMQRAVDALYMLSRAWEDEEQMVRLDRAAVVKCLLKRTGADAAHDGADPVARKPGVNVEPVPQTPKGTTDSETRKNASLSTKSTSEGSAKAEDARDLEAALLQTGMSLRDLYLVESAVSTLADVLTDVDRLKQWLDKELGQDQQQAAFRGILPPGNLIKLINAERREYRFLFDVYGQDLKTQAALADAPAAAPKRVPSARHRRAVGRQAPARGGLPATAGTTPETTDELTNQPSADPGIVPPPAMPTQSGAPASPAALRPTVFVPPSIAREIEASLAFYEEFLGALALVGIQFQDLIKLQLFPPSIDPSGLKSASTRLRDALKMDLPYEGLPKDLPLLRLLLNFVNQNADALSILFRLALKVARDARDPMLRLEEALAAIMRYVPAGSPLTPNVDVRASLSFVKGLPFDIKEGIQLPNGGADTVVSWVEQLKGWQTEPAGPVFQGSETGDIWDAAAKRVREYAVTGTSDRFPVSYRDILCGAANFAPGNLLRGDLRQVTLTEWSELCLLGYPAGTDTGGPLWSFIAGLSILGFDRQVVKAAIELPIVEGRGDPHKDFFSLFLSTAPDKSPSGIVLMTPDGGPSIAASEEGWPRRDSRKDRVPILALSQEKLSRYHRAIEWLSERKAITRFVYEEAE